MAKAKDHKVFNIKKRWLRRTYIPTAEFYASVALIVTATATGLWFFNQKDNYDHGERDLDPNLLGKQATLELYTRPLKLWQEPGTASGPAAGPSIAPFPAATLDPNWQLGGRVKTFEPDNLFEKINGEAEKFLKLNFQQLHYLVLKSAQDRSEIAIELYDHGDVTHSIGIFSGHTSPNNDIQNISDLSYFMTGAGMIGRKGRFFFRVAATNFDDPIKNKVLQLAQSFTQLGAPLAAAPQAIEVVETPASSDMPVEFLVLNENLSIAQDAIAFASQNVFQFDFASNFWFGNFADSEDGKAFIHIADSADAVQELYKQLLVEFDFDYTLVQSLENGVLLKHRFLNNYLVMQHQGRVLFGVENLADQAKVPQLMSQLNEGINEKAI